MSQGLSALLGVVLGGIFGALVAPWTASRFALAREKWAFKRDLCEQLVCQLLETRRIAREMADALSQEQDGDLSDWAVRVSSNTSAFARSIEMARLWLPRSMTKTLGDLARAHVAISDDSEEQSDEERAAYWRDLATRTDSALDDVIREGRELLDP